MGDFLALRVWVKAKDLAVFIHRVTDKGLFSKDYGLKDQIRRATVSIPSNIAEGEELGTNKQSIKYFNISKGSAAEVLTQAIIAFEIGYLGKEDFVFIEQECRSISKMLNKLIQSRSNSLGEPLPDYPDLTSDN
ncbi:MAG: four helix bundle protein [Bacteroidia bacterium]|nr:four helix bundle protein [Bacteroidia bacterium]